MADNTVLNTGTGGDVIATDDIAGVKYQRVKVVYGVDGAATDASATNPLPVVVGAALPAGTAALGKVAVAPVGRSQVNFTAEAVAGATAETAVSVAKSVGLAAPTAATTHGPTTGKTLRITGITLTNVATATTANNHRLRLRVNATGAATTTSPVQWSQRVGFNTATWAIAQTATLHVAIPDGLDIPSGGTCMVTIQSVAANGTIDLSMTGIEFTP